MLCSIALSFDFDDSVVTNLYMLFAFSFSLSYPILVYDMEPSCILFRRGKAPLFSSAFSGFIDRIHELPLVNTNTHVFRICIYYCLSCVHLLFSKNEHWLFSCCALHKYFHVCSSFVSSSSFIQTQSIARKNSKWTSFILIISTVLHLQDARC